MADNQAFPYDDDKVRALVTACANRQTALFEHFPTIELDDLIQIGMVEAPKAHASYDRAKAAYSTHITGCVHRRYIDLYRSLCRRAAREGRAAAARPTEYHPAFLDNPAIDLDDPALPLHVWLSRVHNAIFMMHETYAVHPVPRRGRPHRYQAAVVLALRSLVRKKLPHITTRGLHELLSRRADLRESLGIQHAPSHEWLRQKVSNKSPSPEKPRRNAA